MKEFRLREYGTVVVPPEIAAAFERASEGRIRQVFDGGQVALAATSWVGTVRIPDAVLRVVPKVGFRNVFGLLLESADVPLHHLQGLAPVGEDDDVNVVLATLYARAVADVVRRGVLRGYREVRSREIALRGRPDVPRMLQRPGQVTPIDCRWEQFGVDIDLNQHLLAAASRARRTPDLPRDTRLQLQHARVALEGVDEHGAPSPSWLDTRHLTRLEAHYAPALRLAQLVRQGGALSHTAGDVTAGTLLLDMNKVFESYVGRWLQRNVGDGLRADLQDDDDLDADGQVRIRPDIVIRDADTGRVLHVGDIKYKISDDATGRNPDYYQLLTYCIAHDVPSGTLVYASRVGPQLPSVVVPKHQPIALRAHPVDVLDGHRAKAMAALVDGIRAAARPVRVGV